MANEQTAVTRPQVFIKTHKFPVRVDAEVYAAEQRAKGAEAWVTYTVKQGYVVTVRRIKAVQR